VTVYGDARGGEGLVASIAARTVPATGGQAEGGGASTTVASAVGDSGAGGAGRLAVMSV
jgi:hypothetical protein